MNNSSIKRKLRDRIIKFNETRECDDTNSRLKPVQRVNDWSKLIAIKMKNHNNVIARNNNWNPSKSCKSKDKKMICTTLLFAYLTMTLTNCTAHTASSETVQNSKTNNEYEKMNRKEWSSSGLSKKMNSTWTKRSDLCSKYTQKILG